MKKTIKKRLLEIKKSIEAEQVFQSEIWHVVTKDGGY